MTIYIISGLHEYVYFKFYDSNYPTCKEEYTKIFGDTLKATKTTAFLIMENIDNWYRCQYDEGCVRFEIG